MPLPRRAPGQRLRLSRRNQELEQIERNDPEKYAELIELRRLSPQAYRKELTKMIKRGKILKGRSFEVPDEQLALLDTEDVPTLLDLLERGAADGSIGFRALHGLAQEEGVRRARPDVIAAIKRLAAEVMEAEGRQLR